MTEPATAQQNEEVVRAVFAEVSNGQDAERINERLRWQYVHDGPLPELRMGADG